ncbi:MAG: hypothetical protein HOH14_03005 [Gammaproteobacteria bacterium]|jgi:hypothetical protein|nr:hypothetical protein [Gammaproteobacteria bacterium]MBT6042444.1 hypothetical protein [Gammaproteobacteria bacterium]
MKFLSNSLSAAKSLAGIILLFALSAQLHAAAMLSLSGSAMDVKYENDTEVRLSLIDWSSVEERAEVEKAYREYQKNNDLEGFLAKVEQQETRGYFFSAAATGYRIKYAWKKDMEGGQEM